MRVIFMNDPQRFYLCLSLLNGFNPKGLRELMVKII